MPQRLRFYGEEGEDIDEFLEVVEDKFDDHYDYEDSPKKRSRELSKYAIRHLRDWALEFAEQLPKSVRYRWSKLSAALLREFEDDEDSSNTESSNSDSESDLDSCDRHIKKVKKKSDKSKRLSQKREKQPKSAERKSRKRQGSECSVRRDLGELHEMVQNVIKIRNAAVMPNTGGVATRRGTM